MDAALVIEKLELVPHPEGGFYRETYRATETSRDVAAHPGSAERAWSTAIYFLLTRDAFSALHRIASDELWHFYLGDAIAVTSLDSVTGVLRRDVLGASIEHGQAPQLVVPAGRWFGARLVGDGAWGLVGCTVSPGFDFRDFELGDRDALRARWPEHRQVIESLTRAK